MSSKRPQSLLEPRRFRRSKNLSRVMQALKARHSRSPSVSHGNKFPIGPEPGGRHSDWGRPSCNDLSGQGNYFVVFDSRHFEADCLGVVFKSQSGSRAQRADVPDHATGSLEAHALWTDSVSAANRAMRHVWVRVVE